MARNNIVYEVVLVFHTFDSAPSFGWADVKRIHGVHNYTIDTHRLARVQAMQRRMIDPRTPMERELDDLYTAQKETENSVRPGGM